MSKEIEVTRPAPRVGSLKWVKQQQDLHGGLKVVLWSGNGEE